MSTKIDEAVRDVQRARLALRHAVERLHLELPKAVDEEIHYNGQNANVPAEYAEAKAVLVQTRGLL